MKTKVLIISIVLMAILTVGVVSAANIQEVGGLKFNIPDGYSPGYSYSISTSGHDSDSANFDNGDSHIGIAVENKTGVSLNDVIKNETRPLENKTIAGINGCSETTNDGIRFIYVQGDKVVYITAPDESVIESMIVK